MALNSLTVTPLLRAYPFFLLVEMDLLPALFYSIFWVWVCVPPLIGSGFSAFFSKPVYLSTTSNARDWIGRSPPL